MQLRTIVTLDGPGGSIYVKKAEDFNLTYPFKVYFDDESDFENVEHLHESYKTLTDAMKAVAELIKLNVERGFYED